MSSRLREINRILVTLHPTDEDIGAREIDREHRDRGYLQIRYHFVIRRDGAVDAGRPVSKATSPCGAIVIGVVGSDLTVDQDDSLRGIIQSLQGIHPITEVEGLPASVQRERLE